MKQPTLAEWARACGGTTGFHFFVAPVVDGNLWNWLKRRTSLERTWKECPNGKWLEQLFEDATKPYWHASLAMIGMLPDPVEHRDELKAFHKAINAAMCTHDKAVRRLDDQYREVCYRHDMETPKKKRLQPDAEKRRAEEQEQERVAQEKEKALRDAAATRDTEKDSAAKAYADAIRKLYPMPPEFMVADYEAWKKATRGFRVMTGLDEKQLRRLQFLVDGH